MLSKNKFIPILKDSKDKVDLARKVADELDNVYGTDLKAVVFDDGEWTELLRERVPDNFCLYPFIHFQLDPDGRARPCCKYKVGDASWQQDVPKLPDVNIGELWEQDEFQSLRDKFLRNERPSGCKACWDEEAAGIKSMRLHRELGGKQHPFATFFHHIPRTYPKTLDLKLSNLCNLKCRICTPFLSSQWMKEIKDLNINDLGTYDSFFRNSREKFSENPKNEEILKEWAPSIDHLEFYGGEPLMQQEHNKILQIISEYGNPKNTGLYYNTNGTICDEDFFKMWSRFGHVVINFSIDDIGERFEYERKNAKWDEILNNVIRYREYAAQYNINMELKFYTTVGILNVFYLKEFLEFAKQYNVQLVLNMVHYPHHFSITNLPNEVKDLIKEKLLSIEVGDIFDSFSPGLENVINFMYGSELNPELIKTFFTKIRVHDRYRNESFEKTFPELYEMLKHYE